MSCDQPQPAFAYGTATAVTTGSLPGSPSGTPDGVNLVLSNDPELISHALGSDQNANLYGCKVPLTSGANAFRIFIWHKNDVSATRYLKLLVRVDSSDGGTLSGLQWADDATTWVRQMGNCLACVQLFGGFPSSGSNISLTANDSLVWSKSFTSNQVIGAVVEFSVTVDQACNLILRTMAATTSGDTGSWDGSDETASKSHSDSHYAGWWTQASLLMLMPAFDVKPSSPGQPEPMYFRHCDTGGPEAAAYVYRGSATDPNGHDPGNPGCYGVNLYYQYQLTNSGTQGYPGWMAEQAMRSTSATEYHGAAWDYTTQDLAYQGYTDQLYASTYGAIDVSEGSEYTVPANTPSSSPMIVEVWFANGGGATMPFATVWNKIGYNWTSGGQ